MELPRTHSLHKTYTFSSGAVIDHTTMLPSPHDATGKRTRHVRSRVAGMLLVLRMHAGRAGFASASDSGKFSK